MAWTMASWTTYRDAMRLFKTITSLHDFSSTTQVEKFNDRRNEVSGLFGSGKLGIPKRSTVSNSQKFSFG
jgi:hypothetical protein